MGQSTGWSVWCLLSQLLFEWPESTPQWPGSWQKNRDFATILALGRNEDVGNMDPSPVMLSDSAQHLGSEVEAESSTDPTWSRSNRWVDLESAKHTLDDHQQNIRLMITKILLSKHEACSEVPILFTVHDKSSLVFWGNHINQCHKKTGSVWNPLVTSSHFPRKKMLWIGGCFFFHFQMHNKK